MKKLILALSLTLAFYSSSFAQWTNSTDINNTNTGNVGIGTSSPAAKLDIWPAGSGSVLRGNSGGSIIVPAFELNGYNTNVSNAGLTISTNDGGTFSEKMRIASNGDVGIGTTNPAVKLDVHGSTYSANFQNTAASNSPVVSISQTNAGGNDAAQGLYIDARSTGSALDIYNSSTPLFRVKNNGNIGIGTANPLALLSVNVPSVTAGTRNPLLVGEVGNSVITNAIYNTVESATPFGWGLAFDTYKVNTGQIEAMRINNAGYVGIGTTSPDEKLTVNGTIHSREVKVDTSIPVPDYVFEDQYQLKSLTDVKAYVDKHHHLPEIPSAKEIEKSGIQLGDMNMRLLKKVEELTLYLIEKDDQVKKQQQQLNEQQAQLDAIRIQVANLIQQAK